MRITILLVLFASLHATAGEGRPVIDVHVHAPPASEVPPGRQGMCVPMMPTLPAPTSLRDWPGQLMQAMANPACDDPVWSAGSAEALMGEVIAELEKNNAVGIISGPPESVNAWKAAAPDRFIKSLQLRLTRDPYSVEEARSFFEDGGFLILGEVSNQYAGIEPDHPDMRPWWAMAEEMDVPVQIHMGSGPPGFAAFYPDYRVAHGNPLLLEPVLARHPNLRISIMHMAEGFNDQLIMMLWAYPQIYVDIGAVMWGHGTDYFYAQLKTLVDAGYGKRIMFGSDPMIWPGLISKSVGIIEAAGFLTEEQKADILFNNAVRFFGFDEDAMRARALGE